MFGLGVPEIVIIGVVAVLVFGPKRIPELGSSLGKSLRMFQEGRNAPDEEEENYIEEAED